MAATQQHIKLVDAIEKRKLHKENITYLRAKLADEQKKHDQYDRQIKNVEDR